jgi:hypothetical protein
VTKKVNQRFGAFAPNLAGGKTSFWTTQGLTRAFGAVNPFNKPHDVQEFRKDYNFALFTNR